MPKENRGRKSNIELLRILAAAGVILLHFNNPAIGGALKEVNLHSGNAYLLFGLESIAICAVDLFMLISGFFLYGKLKVNVKRVLSLLLQVIVLRVIFLFINELQGTQTITPKGALLQLLPVNYFVITYCCVYILSPFINLLLVSLDQRTSCLFAGVVVLLFSVIPFVTDLLGLFTGWNLNAMSTVTNAGNCNGYSVVNYTMMYIIGALLAKIRPRISKAGCAAVLFVSWAIVFAGGYSYMSTQHGFGPFLGYHCPAVILMAVCLFLLFDRWEIGSNRLINHMASASFTVYLTHIFFLTKMETARYVNSSTWKLAVYIILLCTVLYVAGYLIHLLYEAVLSLIRKKSGISLPDLMIDLRDMKTASHH